MVYEIEVFGDEELLTWWPDENDDALRPVNQDLMDEIGDENTASGEDMHRYYDSITWWTSRTVRAPNGDPMVVLTTWADLTPDELAQPARQKEISDLFIQRRTDAESILAAVATQVAKFYDVDLPEMLRQRAAVRRAHLDNVNMTFRTIGLPTE